MFKPFVKLNVASLGPDGPVTVSCGELLFRPDPMLNYIFTELATGHRAQ